jgi:hypothetical protein
MGWRFVEARFRIVERAPAAAAGAGQGRTAQREASGARMLRQPVAASRFGLEAGCVHQVADPVPMFANLVLKNARQTLSRLRV